MSAVACASNARSDPHPFPARRSRAARQTCTRRCGSIRAPGFFGAALDCGLPARIGSYRVIARHARPDVNHRAPFGEPGARLAVFGKARRQSVEPLRDAFAWKARQRGDSTINHDPRQPACSLDDLNEGRSIRRRSARRWPESASRLCPCFRQRPERPCETRPRRRPARWPWRSIDRDP